MIPMLGKAGAGSNSPIETMCVWSIFVGIFCGLGLGSIARSSFAEGTFGSEEIVIEYLADGHLIIQMAIMPVSIGALEQRYTKSTSQS